MPEIHVMSVTSGETLNLSESQPRITGAISPTVDLERTDDGVEVTVQDVHGTQTAMIYDGAQGPQGPAGAQGPAGERGPQGEAGPQGPQGETGPTGATGATGPAGYSPTATVSKSGTTATITITDATGTTTATVSDGAQGPQGVPGAKGDPGDPGATPAISIGTVSTLEPGEDATVTIGGTAEAPVLSFGIPQGAKGDDGRTIQSDWTQTDSSQPDFIKNKPVVEELTIPKDGTICTYINGKALKVLGSLVMITCKFGLTSGYVGWRTIATMPVGWRPAADVGFFAGRGGTPASVRDGFVRKNGIVEIYKESSDTYLYATITYTIA